MINGRFLGHALHVARQRSTTLLEQFSVQYTEALPAWELEISKGSATTLLLHYHVTPAGKGFLDRLLNMLDEGNVYGKVSAIPNGLLVTFSYRLNTTKR